jgi:hypothetical protein
MSKELEKWSEVMSKTPLKVGNILCKHNNPAEVFEIQSLDWYMGILVSLKNPNLFERVDISRWGECHWVLSDNEKEWVFANPEDIKNNRKNEMNTNNFKVFIEALEALPDDIKNNEVSMNSTLRPNPFCGTVGCFAGLVSIVAEDIPELKQAYEFDGYNYSAWALALNSFLNCRFDYWAGRNETVWNNIYGGRLYSHNTAFGKIRGDVLTHNDIIVYLRGVYDRWIDEVGEVEGEDDD